MIKFFRKIRQKLLGENRFSKYMIYAIGEIALVVIGILIALSINNSNEYRKNRETEKVYLNSLYDELLRDSAYFESTESRLNAIEESGRNVIAVLAHPNKQVNDSLKFLMDIRLMIALDQKLPEPIIWKELQSSGNLRLIENRGLIEMLYKHYHEVASCQKDYNDNAHPFILKGRYFDSKTFSISDQDDYFDNWKKDNVSSPEVFSVLLHDEEFHAIAKGIITGMMISKQQLLDVKKSVKLPLQLLRNEINNKKK